MRTGAVLVSTSNPTSTISSTRTISLKPVLGDPHEWTVSLLLALYYDVMSYAPVGHLLWGEFSKMSEGELRAVVQALEETSACLVKTA